MRGKQFIPYVAAAFFACVPLNLALSAQAPEDIARQSAQSLNLQTDLPIKEFDEAGDSPHSASQTDSGAISAKGIFWVTAIIAIILAAALFWNSSWGIDRTRTVTADEDEEAEAIVRRGEETLFEAEDWVQRGNLVEAMRVLLTRSLGEMRMRLGFTIAASLTSREILEHVSLPQDGRSALANIVGRVERAYFGNYPVTAVDYESCRDSFETLVLSLSGGKTA